jgi:hypothetical protein
LTAGFAPAARLAALLRGDAPGTIAARRMLVATVIGLSVLGWLRIEGARHGLFSDAVGTTLLVTAVLIVATGLAAATARRLNAVAGELDDERARLTSVLAAATD